MCSTQTHTNIYVGACVRTGEMSRTQQTTSCRLRRLHKTFDAVSSHRYVGDTDKI